VAHVTRDSDTTFKVKGQSHQTTLVAGTGRPTWTYSNGDLSIWRISCHHLQALAGAYIVAAARLQLIFFGTWTQTPRCIDSTLMFLSYR